MLGLLPSSECQKKECGQSENNDPVSNKCYIKDGYSRTMLYRAWRPACSDLHIHSDKLAREYFSYILDYSDTIHYGSKVVVRCLIGFTLNPASHSFVSHWI